MGTPVNPVDSRPAATVAAEPESNATPSEASPGTPRGPEAEDMTSVRRVFADMTGKADEFSAYCCGVSAMLQVEEIQPTAAELLVLGARLAFLDGCLEKCRTKIDERLIPALRELSRATLAPE